MNVLIFGGTGLLGSAAAQIFIDRGHKVKTIALPRLPEGAPIPEEMEIEFGNFLELTDEELEMLESWDSLESLYTDCYTHNDFERELKGLERFDKDNKLGVFDSLAFQSIIDTCKEEVIEKSDEQDPQSLQDLSMVETILDYTILEAANTLQLVSFNNQLKKMINRPE